MIKSLWAQRNQMTVNRGILCRVWELLDTDEIRLLQLIPRQNIPEILRAITEACLGLEKALAKVPQRACSEIPTAAQAQLGTNPVEIYHSKSSLR
ncbi:hypothetical protein T4B_6029 [Trichinella pseudospiralis]|uniref:Uncharacterized protein n=1 Tax=Trichinella pseudospiralis TaxID=6337 RepID=A0A0V1IW55_TRIPS|nr:hypothetical protein T4B_6029 [Trichinella pseudospiralis]KRZ41536.1 hypothetical protein T4C_2399 [Trichinella pseudospiralis]